MRKALSLLALSAVIAAITSGCAGTEEKMGRGIRNVTEPVRMGDMRQSVQQESIWYGPNDGLTVGVIRGFDRTLERTGLGAVEIITAPFPPYHPIFTQYIPAEPVYPDGNVPGLPDDPTFQTDYHMGFSSGNEAFFMPGNRFDVFNQ
jgi:putative exosortase-associated protein (TIGR04073 family)